MRIDNAYLADERYKSDKTCPANLSFRQAWCPVLSGQETHMPSLVEPYFRKSKNQLFWTELNQIFFWKLFYWFFSIYLFHILVLCFSFMAQNWSGIACFSEKFFIIIEHCRLSAIMKIAWKIHINLFMYALYISNSFLNKSIIQNLYSSSCKNNYRIFSKIHRTKIIS